MPNSKGSERRVVDPVQQQIEDLILSADNPKDKAFLLIMNKISLSLDANTILTESLSKDFKAQTSAFQAHEEQELTIVNQSKGGFRVAIVLLRVAIVLLAVIQFIGGAIVRDTLNEVKSIRKDLTSVQRTIEIQQAQLK